MVNRVVQVAVGSFPLVLLRQREHHGDTMKHVQLQEVDFRVWLDIWGRGREGGGGGSIDSSDEGCDVSRCSRCACA